MLPSRASDPLPDASGSGVEALAFGNSPARPSRAQGSLRSYHLETNIEIRIEASVARRPTLVHP
jgi:hypothetical protein